MSKRPNDGGPAFPRPVSEGNSNFVWEQDGMTLRQWYAGMALQGLCSSNKLLEKFLGTAGELGTTFLVVLASSAFEAADAMLAHEAKEREGT